MLAVLRLLMYVCYIRISEVAFTPVFNKRVKQSRHRPEVPRGFQEVKVPIFRDNDTG